MRGVKFAAYFDELTAGTGALRLVPGSHHPEQNARMAGYCDRQMPARDDAEAAAYQASFPGFIADTSPGDVIAFDLHTWHASTGGRDRLAWTAVYQRCPETGSERERTLRSVLDSFEQAFRGFDRDRYPIWRDWIAETSAHPRRAGVIERMRHDAFGARRRFEDGPQQMTPSAADVGDPPEAREIVRGVTAPTSMLALAVIARPKISASPGRSWR